ncbi:MAG: M48 family metalloprotease, partial [Proteobacteria bacterium]|nr:M48 family metalloprotease [Pseudomonadota bacterium]
MRTHIITIVCIVFFISQFFLASFVFGQDADFRKRASQLREGYETSDIEAEILFGRELAAKILGQYSLLKDEELQRYVSLLGTGISAQLGRSELKYHFAVIESDDLNAYACPGGYIFITSGALKVMTNEAQLVGVLTHELTHVDQRHVVKELKIKGTDTSVTSGMAGLLGGSTTSVRVALDMLADKAFNLLFKEGLSKKDEFEADALGVTAMTTLGYDWKSYRDLVASLQNLIYAGAGETLSKTHPSISQRVEGIETAVANSGFQKLQGKRNAERFNKFVQFEEISVAQNFSDFDTRAEIALGRESAALILGKYKLLDNDAVQKYVATLGTGISAQVG